MSSSELHTPSYRIPKKAALASFCLGFLSSERDFTEKSLLQTIIQLLGNLWGPLHWKGALFLILCLPRGGAPGSFDRSGKNQASGPFHVTYMTIFHCLWNPPSYHHPGSTLQSSSQTGQSQDHGGFYHQPAGRKSLEANELFTSTEIIHRGQILGFGQPPVSTGSWQGVAQ